MARSIYQKLGIDPHKSSVREIFGSIVQNDFPGMFVNVVRDRNDPGWVKTKHPDGDGSKFLQRILHYLETWEDIVIQGAVDDAFSMNTGDIAAGGSVHEYDITQICNVGDIGSEMKELILRQIALRLVELFALYREHGFLIDFFGGETADLPDQVSSIVYDMDIWSRMREVDLIKGNVVPGDKIWGFASDGKAFWEDAWNSGIGSNGLTMARIDLMHKHYAKKYPWLCRKDEKNHFRGRFSVTDSHRLLEPLELTVSEAIMSPTRQWAIVIRMLTEKLKREGAFQLLHGISMNTGGGATKIQHVGEGILYVKEMPPFPAFFKLIQSETGETDDNMLTTFNCGIGIDVAGSTEGGVLENALKFVSAESGIDLFDLGACYESPTEGNKVKLTVTDTKLPSEV
jgi:phosphoribosylformylglycinamidine cyclo-ligase